MKRKIKGLLLTLVMVLGMIAMTQKSMVMAAPAELTEEAVQSYKSSAVATIEAFTAYTDEQLEEAKAAYTDEAMVAIVDSWQAAKAEIGAFVEVTEQTVEAQGDEIIINSTIKCEKGTANASIILIASGAEVNLKSMSFDVNYSMGQKLKQAGLNTLMGVGVVFVMLVFLSLCILSFKFIPTGKKQEVQSAAPVMQSAPAETKPVVADDTEDLMNDNELVAVIAAAIAASENTTIEGFRVRSIKKANRKAWKNA